MVTTPIKVARSPEHEASVISPDLQQRQSQQQQEDETPTTTASARIVEPLNVESPQDTEPNYPTGSKFWFTIIALCVVVILGGLDANIVATAVPSITDHFHTVADVGWYSSAFRLCTCAFQFGFAKLYKLFSIKTIFFMSNVIFLFGSLLCATAASSTMFIVGRAITGVGFAGELAGCFAVVVHILPLNRRPVFSGLMACVESLAIIAAPIVGGALTQSLGWRWCFWINLPIGAISLTAMFFLFSDPRTPQEDDLTMAQKIRELDLVSNCLFIPSLTALFIALSWAGTKYPWSDGKVIGLFVVFAVSLGSFVLNQRRRGESAALPFRIIKSRSVIAGFIFTACTNSMTNVLEWYLPTYYQVVRSKTPSESGYLMIPILVGMMLGLFLQGIGTTTFGYYAPFMVFASICMPIAAGLMTTYNLHTSLAKIIFYSGFAGFSGGIGFQGSQAAVQTTLSAADVNLGIGVILFGQSMGPAVFIAIAQVIFTNKLSSILKDVVPGLTPAYIEEHGLGDIKNGIPVQQWDEVLAGIDQSLTQTWYLTVALACTTMVGSLLIEWRSVKQKQS
ncbi:putative efflux pump antibiotic resistance protein [Talaromyces proteolyticus]|uniref:Efflux pump antibiotic resistance protein n=1 Tax=Talaromyces proteolyticus TaxID=1131652 RepID=A0AAD4PTF0_9EURO|nr:putative efflux pump antibiotic resistance protein [Talaromyces proteolyticus]KAH8690696.1 putative efflux pump antibiotic resistance protein [Talaromyces proteolyticus]